MSRKQFYNSAVWEKERRYIWLKQKCLCAKCHRPVYVDGISEWIPKEHRVKGIVHHKEHLNDINYTDENISLNENNLIGLCIFCHNEEHGRGATKSGYMFDELGNLIPRINSPH